METNKHGIGCIAYDSKCGILTKISKYKNKNSLLLTEINFYNWNSIRNDITINADIGRVLASTVILKLSVIQSQMNNHIFLEKLMLPCKT